MRKLILKMECSLDGFVGGPNGELDWLFPDFDVEHGEWLVEKLWQAGAHVMGSVTYRGMAAHWPSSTEPYAEPMNRIPKIVFSANLTEADWGEVRVVSIDPATEIARLKRESGKDLLAHGGARFAQYLIRSKLIDEYWLVVHPVAVGSGLRLFPDLAAPIRLRLIDRTAFKSGVTAMTFQPA